MLWVFIGGINRFDQVSDKIIEWIIWRAVEDKVDVGDANQCVNGLQRILRSKITVRVWMPVLQDRALPGSQVEEKQQNR